MPDRNAHADKPWPKEDHRRLIEELRGWGMTWRRGEPCRECGWPFPDAPYHIHPEPLLPDGPTYD